MPQQSGKLKNIFSSRFFVFIAGAVLMLLIISYSRALYQDYQIHLEITRLQSEAKNLEAKKLETLEMLKYVKSDAYVEEKARTELNLMKPGEKLAIIEGSSTPKNSGQDQVKVVKSSNISNPEKWWQYFFGTDE